MKHKDPTDSQSPTNSFTWMETWTLFEHNPLNITFVVSLAIHSDDADPPGLGAVWGQLGDVGGHAACPDAHTVLVDAGDVATKVAELGNYKLILESLGDNLEVLFHNPVNE